MQREHFRITTQHSTDLLIALQYRKMVGLTTNLGLTTSEISMNRLVTTQARFGGWLSMAMAAMSQMSLLIMQRIMTLSLDAISRTVLMFTRGLMWEFMAR